MRYVQRDRDGNLVGHFANPQSYAAEEVADDHPDILAFAQRIADAKAAYMTLKAAASPAVLLAEIEALKAKVADLEKR